MTTPYYQDDRVTLHHGDCLEVLRTLPDASIDAVVTDPPYGLEFMGKDWDRFSDTPPVRRSGYTHADSGAGFADSHKGTLPTFGGRWTSECTGCGRRDAFAGNKCRCENGPTWQRVRTDGGATLAAFQRWCEQWATECLRVLKPGGHLLAFGGSRTWHRLACAIEDAGFEIRDSIAWLYSQGFPKSMNPGRDQRFCQGCEVESGHGDDDLRGVRTGVSDLAAHAASGEVADVLAPVQRQGAGSPVGDLRAPRADRQRRATSGHVRGGQPSLEGRGDLQAAEGQLRGAALRKVPGGPAVHGEVGRLRDGAPASDGSSDRATAAEVGSGESHQPRPTGQPTGEPGAVPEQRGSQAGRGGQVCAGCGKPPAPVGLGTALKPSFEPIVVGRKPLAGTVAANVLAHGTGALNIDACRVGDEKMPRTTSNGVVVSENASMSGPNYERVAAGTAVGRWPTNVVLDNTQNTELDRQSADVGELGASRYFPTFRYETKAPTSERPHIDGTAHPTVKPLNLMRWLIRLTTPPGGTVLEPFAGSGTTVEACIVEGPHCIAIERDTDYLPLITQRINRRLNPVEAIRQAGDDLGLFDIEEGA